MSEQHLKKVTEAALSLGVSKTYLYKLPRATPGVYAFGRAVRYDIEELRAWAAGQARGALQKMGA